MDKTNVEVISQEIIIIEEDIYQQYKKKKCKRDDYFTIKELDNMLKYKKK